MKKHLHIKTIMLVLVIIFSFHSHTKAQDWIKDWVNWEKYESNPVIESAPWSTNTASFPVVIFEDDVFKMWFCGKDTMSNKCGIAYAESMDGINWIIDDKPVIYPGNPGEWDLHRYPGSVLRVNDTLKMWFVGSEDNAFTFAIGYAYYSEDSAKWTLNSIPVLEKGSSGSWDDAFVNGPSVIYDGQTYHMWYFGWEGGSWFNPALVGYASSQDGINWIKDTLNNPVTSPGPADSFYDVWASGPNVIEYADTFRMYFTGWDGTSSATFKYLRIGYATSLDGINWEVQNNDEPVLDVGKQGEWDEDWVRYKSVLIHEGRLKMWYDGTRDLASHLKIGYAIGETLPTPPGITEHKSDLISTVYPNPFATHTTLSYTLDKPGNIRFTVYNVQSQIVYRMEEEQGKGKQTLQWNAEGLPAGMYYFRIQAGEMLGSEKIVKME